MTRPTTRVLALLELLQAGGRRTVGELAERLGVDERTVRRYLAHLVDLEIPVETVRGRYGGVRLVPGYRMPPLMLTADEALAVLLGLVAGQRAGLLGGAGVAAESAVAKLQRVLPRALGSRLAALLDTVAFTAPGRTSAAPTGAVLLTVAEAARERRPVQVDYTSADGRASRRTLHPYGVVAHAGRWYAGAADSASGEVRTFRLDRITDAELLPGSFDVPTDHDPAGALLASLATAPHRFRVQAQVRGTTEDVAPLLPPGLAAITDAGADPGWVRVVIGAEQLGWVPGVLAGLGRPFRIEGPDELRPLVRVLAARLSAAADGGSGG